LRRGVVPAELNDPTSLAEFLRELADCSRIAVRVCPAEKPLGGVSRTFARDRQPGAAAVPQDRPGASADP